MEVGYLTPFPLHIALLGTTPWPHWILAPPVTSAPASPHHLGNRKFRMALIVLFSRSDNKSILLQGPASSEIVGVAHDIRASVP
jgi:hypothetical protein